MCSFNNQTLVQLQVILYRLNLSQLEIIGWVMGYNCLVPKPTPLPLLSYTCLVDHAYLYYWLYDSMMWMKAQSMDLLPDTQNCGLRMRGECQERFPRHRLQMKPLVSDLAMHHGMCATHMPWCMSGSPTRGGGENVPGIPGARATRSFAYLVRDPCKISCKWRKSLIIWGGGGGGSVIHACTQYLNFYINRLMIVSAANI